MQADSAFAAAPVLPALASPAPSASACCHARGGHLQRTHAVNAASVTGLRRSALNLGLGIRIPRHACGQRDGAIWSTSSRRSARVAFTVHCSGQHNHALKVSNLPYLASGTTNVAIEPGKELLSTRGRALQPLMKVMERVQPAVEAVMANPFDANSNPNGMIDMGLAQSRLTWDLLKEGVSGPRFVTSQHAYYGPYRGLNSFRTSLATFLETFLGAPVRPEDLVLAPGTTGAIDALANVFFDDGDAVLLAAPYYYYFDMDLAYRAHLRLVPVETDPGEGFTWTPQDFEERLEAAEAAGLRVRGILLCNPDNPLGRTVSREQMRGLVDLCARRDLHLISDEVYANNVHGGCGAEFVSAWGVAAGTPAEQRVHVAWGFSKDFGLSGYRVGVAASRNGAAVEAMSTLSRFSGVSSDTQATLAPLVNDREHALRFLATHQARPPARRAALRPRQARLLSAYDNVVGALDEIQVPYVPASACPFVWARLAPHARDFNDEQAAFAELAREGVYVMPGAMFHCTEPGWFRIVYAHREAALAEGLRRIASAVRRINPRRAAVA